MPFTLYVKANQTIQARCVIFRPIPTPIAFVEMDITGVLVPQTFADNLQEFSKFPQNAGDESIR